MLLLLFTCVGNVKGELKVGKELTTTISAEESVAKAQIDLANTGTVPVTIQRMEADCSCISLESPKGVIAANGKLAIVATAKLKNPASKQVKTIIIFTNDERDSVIAVKWIIVRSDRKVNQEG